MATQRQHRPQDRCHEAPTTAKRSTTAKKAAATRAAATRPPPRASRSTAAKKAAETRAELAKTPVDRAQEYAERAVLVPVGALLVARDSVVARPSSAARQRDLARQGREGAGTPAASACRPSIKRFERRGRTERNRVERQVKKARTRVERELRQRRAPRRARASARPARTSRRRPTCSAPASRTSCRPASPAARRSPPRSRSASPASRSTTSPPAGLERSRRRSAVSHISTDRSSTSPPSKRPAIGGPFLRRRPGERPCCLQWTACPPATRSSRRSRPSSTPSCAARSSSSRWSARSTSPTTAPSRHGLADHARLPDPQPLRDRRRHRPSGRSTACTTRQRRLRRALRQREGRAAAEARPPGALPEGALAQVSNVVCIGSGKGGVGKSTVTANLAAALAADGKTRRRPRRRRLGLLDPAHVRPRRRPPAGLAERKILPLEAPRREGHVDRLLRRGGQRRRLARADAPQGAHAVPRGRRVGRAGLPARRPAAGHRRRLDDAGPAAARRRSSCIVTTPQPTAQKVARRAAEMAHKVDLEIARRRSRTWPASRRPSGERFADLRRGRRSGAGRRARRAAARQGAADDAAARAGRRRRAAGLHRPRRPGLPGDPPGRPRAAWRCSRSSCRSCSRGPAAPAAAPTGMSLPMAG